MTTTEKIQFVIGVQNRYSKGFKAFASTATRSFKVAAGAATAYTVALAAMTKTYANAGDAALDFSQRIGADVEGLTELHHAAEMSGIGVSTLNMALQRSTRRVAEAAQGYGEARGAIDELGLSAEELAALSPDEQFMRISAALEGVPTHADKVRLAFKLFDSEGVSALQMIDGVVELREEAHLLGITFTQLEAQQASDFNDSLERIGKSFIGVRNTVVKKFVPDLTTAFDVITDEIIDLRRDGDLQRWAEDTVDSTSDIFKSLAFGVAATADATIPAIKGIYNEGILPVWNGFNSLSPALKSVGVVGLFAFGLKGRALLLSTAWLLGKLEEASDNWGAKAMVIGNDVRRVTQDSVHGYTTLTNTITATRKPMAGLTDDLRAYVAASKEGADIGYSEIIGEAKELKDIAPLALLPEKGSFVEKLGTLFDLYEKEKQKRSSSGGGGPDEGGAPPEEKNALLQVQLDTEFSMWEVFYARRVALDEQATLALIQHAELHSMAEKARSNIVGVAYRSMEDATIGLLETGKFSMKAFASVVASQVKIELVGISVRSGVQAIYQYAKGLAAAAEFNPMAAMHFASAKQFGATAAMAGAGAIGTQLVSNAFGLGGSQRPAPGAIGGDPVRTTPVFPTRSIEQSQEAPQTVNIHIYNPLDGDIADSTGEAIVRAVNRAGDRDVTINLTAIEDGGYET